MSVESTDVAIIGGGYYGAFVANEISTQNPSLDILIVEKEDSPFTKASSTNQGQFHMGYMYSGDRALAEECAENIERFTATFGEAIDNDVTSFYGVHKDSEISAEDYAAFCNDLELPLEPINRPADIFGDSIEAAFKSAEKTFNSAEIQKILTQRMAVNGIRLATGFDVQRISQESGNFQLHNHDPEYTINAKHVFNVTFADINGLHERSALPKIPLRHDSFLHFVVDLPSQYKDVAATTIRGPYASLLPSSFRQGHVLASGKYRRVKSTMIDKPSEIITSEEIQSVYDQAMGEATTYMPVLSLAKFHGHTLGTRAAHFDPETGAYTSKAIVFRDFGGVPNYHTVLGGKVSCMFDIAKDLKDIAAEY